MVLYTNYLRLVRNLQLFHDLFNYPTSLRTAKVLANSRTLTSFNVVKQRTFLVKNLFHGLNNQNDAVTGLQHVWKIWGVKHVVDKLEQCVQLNNKHDTLRKLPEKTERKMK